MSDLLLPTKQTFATMTESLRVRLKLHKTLGTTDALTDILKEAHEYVYGELDNGVPQESTITLSPNVATYEWLSDDGAPIARGSVNEVWVGQGSTSRIPLSQGITHAMRDETGTGEPTHYDSLFIDNDWMIEVWPIPSNTYTLYVKHNRALTRFEQPTDKPSAPARLVLLYAIAVGKAHYSQSDAQAAMATFNQMLSREKFRQKENKRYFTSGGAVSQPKPYVVIGANGQATQVWR